MNKFLAAALAAMIVLASDAEDTIRHFRLDRRMIMEKAVRIDSNGERHLDQDFELSAGYSIKFNQCVSLRTEPYNDEILFSESLLAYTAKGQVVSQKSYVLFNVCETQYCSYEADDNTFMVDLDTYMAAISVLYQDMKENYCEACQSSVNFCRYVAYQQKHGNQYKEYKSKYADWGSTENAQEVLDEWDEEWDGEWNEEWGEEQDWQDYYGNNAAQDEDVAEEEGDENQRSRKLQYGLFHPIDCDTCHAFSCFDNAQQQQQAAYGNRKERRLNNEANQYQYYESGGSESLIGWVENIAQCPATAGILDGHWKLYAGFICNQDGSGIDVGLFLDEDCSIYTSRKSFKSVASSYDKAYMYNATVLMTYPTLNTVSCNGEYLSRQEYQEELANYRQGEQHEYGEASDFCQYLFEGGESEGAISLDDCNQDGEEDERAEDAEVDNQSYSYDYYWYIFELSYEDSLSAEASCLVLQSMQGEYKAVYSWRSGQLYNYGTGPLALWEKIRPYVIPAVVAGLMLLATALYFAFNSFRMALLAREKELDSKKEELIQKEEPILSKRSDDSDNSSRTSERSKNSGITEENILQ